MFKSLTIGKVTLLGIEKNKVTYDVTVSSRLYAKSDANVYLHPRLQKMAK